MAPAPPGEIPKSKVRETSPIPADPDPRSSAKIRVQKKLKQSSLYQALAAEDIAEGEARGVAQGVALGKLEAERDLCLKLVKKHYPALLKRATRRIEACTDYPLPPPSEIPKAWDADLR